MDLSRIRDFGAKGGMMVVLIAILVSVSVSVFSHFFYSSRFLESKAGEIQTLLVNGRDFSRVANDILNVRSDVAYIRLLDENGVLKESLGGENGKGVKEFKSRMPGGDTVILGLRESKEGGGSIFYPLLWSVAVGGVIAGVCFLVLSLFSSDQSVYLERLITMMKRVSRGDLTAKLDMDEPIYGDTTIVRVFESFNQMVDQLRKKEEMVREHSGFQPTVVVSDIREHVKSRRVVAFVAKISDFKELSTKLSSAEFSSFLTEYRKAASSIISDYGGVVEALLQDEIVALFNVPDEQDSPELRAISAAVEILQVLGNMSRQRRIEGKSTISGKIGIDEKNIQFYTESGIPQSVKEVIALARGISENAPLWKVIVSRRVYEYVSDHVEVSEIPEGNGKLFSIVAVEEGAIRL